MDGCRLIPEFFVQIKDKLEKVIAKQHELTEKWDKHWEVLQQCEYTHTRSHRYSVVSGGQRAFFFVMPCLLLSPVLEVHQFAQEAAVAEAWLSAQEPLISSRELGTSVDEVEQLIRRHEAFRKAAATWEERFSSLRRLTTVIFSPMI